jgi:hypothetical protein
MRMWRAVRRGLFVVVASGMLSACYHPPYYGPVYGYGYGRAGCRRVWVAPRYGVAGYWSCI